MSRSALALLSFFLASPVFATPAIVQCAGNAASTGSGTTAAVTVTLTAVASGDAIAVIGAAQDSGSSNISSVAATDNKSDTYPTFPACWAWNTAQTCMSAVMLANVTTGPTTVTVTFTGTASASKNVQAEVCEVSNMGTSVTADTGATTNYTSSYGSGLVTDSFTTAVTNEFAIGSLYGAAGSVSYTMSNGWTVGYDGHASSPGQVGVATVLTSAGSNSLQVTPSAATITYAYTAAWEPSGGGGSCTHSGITSAGAIAVPNGTTGSYWGKTGNWVTPDCSTVYYWSPQVGNFVLN